MAIIRTHESFLNRYNDPELFKENTKLRNKGTFELSIPDSEVELFISENNLTLNDENFFQEGSYVIGCVIYDKEES